MRCNTVENLSSLRYRLQDHRGYLPRVRGITGVGLKLRHRREILSADGGQPNKHLVIMSSLPASPLLAQATGMGMPTV